MMDYIAKRHGFDFNLKTVVAWNYAYSDVDKII